MQTRIFLSVGFAALAVITHVLMMRLGGATPAVLAFDAMLGFVSLRIAVRVLVRPTAERDHTTYMRLRLFLVLHRTDERLIIVLL